MPYCRVCEQNSNHQQSSCPQGIDLYHGTRISSISSIMDGHHNNNGGLKPTIGGRIGTGIYFAQQSVAKQIAAHRGNGTGVAVLKCRVNPKKCVTGQHPPWIVNYPFQQWCLNGNNYRITHIYMKDGVINGDIKDPYLNVTVQGNCQFKGNIHMSTLIVSGNLVIG